MRWLKSNLKPKVEGVKCKVYTPFKKEVGIYYENLCVKYDTESYKYYEMYVVKDKVSQIIDKNVGCIMHMTDGTRIIV